MTTSGSILTRAPSYAHGTDPEPLLGQTIGENLRFAVERFPEQEALVVRSQEYRASYRRLWQQTTQALRALIASGVKAGDRVGIWAPNRYEWVVVQFATARMGAILVNINPAYRANELEFALKQSGVSLLLLAREYRGAAYAPMLDMARPNCADLREAVVIDDAWEQWLARGGKVSDADVAHHEMQPQFDDAINIQYTSGTTGFPKGATLTHHNLLNNAHFVGKCLGYTSLDRVCIPVPFYHCFGMVLGNLACVAHGACMVVPSEAFNARSALEAVHAESCTSLYGVPTMFRAILEVPDFDQFRRTSLRTGIMAGAPCPVELMREVVDRLHMPEVAIGYGMTETSPLSTLSARTDSLERRVATVGRVQPHVEISIRVPGSGALLPRGIAGEFCTRGYSVMPGYWRDEAATRAAIDVAGWMHSGDMAVMDEEGYIRIVGRLKDIIIRGGENIAPVEVEAALLAHPNVSEAQVIGILSKKYGEEVMAWVRARPGKHLEEVALTLFCKERLAAFKVPRYWQFVQEFPTTVTGKVQKYKLREMAVEILERQADAREETA